MNPYRLKAYLLLLLVAFIWGLAGPIIKLTLKGLPADVFLVYRFFISGILAILIISIKRLKFPKEPGILRDTIIYCFLNSTVSLGLLFWGLEKTSVLSMSILSLFGPVLMILAGYFLLGDHITKRERVGTLITFIGAIIITVGPIIKTDSSSGQVFGNSLILLSLVSGAASGYYSKKLMRQDVSPEFLANLSFIVGFITLLPFLIAKTGFIIYNYQKRSSNLSSWSTFYGCHFRKYCLYNK
jgi:probable blue pigment (indigoidine) exporter